MGERSRVRWTEIRMHSVLALTHRSSAFFGLSNGGTAGLIYVYLGTAVGFAAVVASMAEMGSM